MMIIKEKEYNKNLANILNYIRKDKILAAKEFKKEISEYINLLKLNPKMGVKYKDLYRRLVYKKYSIIYKWKKTILLY